MDSAIGVGIVIVAVLVFGFAKDLLFASLEGLSNMVERALERRSDSSNADSKERDFDD